MNNSRDAILHQTLDLRIQSEWQLDAQPTIPAFVVWLPNSLRRPSPTVLAADPGPNGPHLFTIIVPISFSYISVSLWLREIIYPGANAKVQWAGGVEFPSEHARFRRSTATACSLFVFVLTEAQSHGEGFTTRRGRFG